MVAVVDTTMQYKSMVPPAHRHVISCLLDPHDDVYLPMARDITDPACLRCKSSSFIAAVDGTNHWSLCNDDDNNRGGEQIMMVMMVVGIIIISVKFRDDKSSCLVGGHHYLLYVIKYNKK
jgi:hypothetical protein